MEQITEMLDNRSEDDDAIQSGDVIIVWPEPLYNTDEEEWNDEEICDHEVKDVPGLLELHTVRKK